MAVLSKGREASVVVVVVVVPPSCPSTMRRVLRWFRGDCTEREPRRSRARSTGGRDGDGSAAQWTSRMLHFVDQVAVDGAVDSIPVTAADLLAVFETGVLAMHATPHGTPEQVAARREIIRVMQLLFGESSEVVSRAGAPDASSTAEEQRGEASPSAPGRRRERDETGTTSRPRADAKRVSMLPLVDHWDEEFLSSLSVGELKKKLRDVRETGGAEDVHCVEKSDLVKALLGSSLQRHDQTECAICLNEFCCGERLRVLPCGHRFHRQCIDVWLVGHCACCPLCQKSVVAA